jgi:hypothetical protein
MIDRVTLNGSGLYVHLSEISLKGTKSFTHGGIFINLAASTIAFASLPPIPLPEGFVPKEGASLDFQLVGPDGVLRKQTRSGVLLANEKMPGILRIGGMNKTKRRFPAEDGWGVIVLKSRAYFTHPGVETDQTIPEWLKDSIARMKGLWNRMAWLCRDARRKCSPAATEEIVAFVKETILPAIDAFNDTLGISKMKMKHPAKLKTDAPGVDGLWNFVGQLRQRIEKARPVPDGLLEQVGESESGERCAEQGDERGVRRPDQNLTGRFDDHANQRYLRASDPVRWLTKSSATQDECHAQHGERQPRRGPCLIGEHQHNERRDGGESKSAQRNRKTGKPNEIKYSNCLDLIRK